MLAKQDWFRKVFHMRTSIVQSPRYRKIFFSLVIVDLIVLSFTQHKEQPLCKESL